MKRASTQHWWAGGGNSLSGATIRIPIGNIDDAGNGDLVSFVFSNTGSQNSDVGVSIQINSGDDLPLRYSDGDLVLHNEFVSGNTDQLIRTVMKLTGSGTNSYYLVSYPEIWRQIIERDSSIDGQDQLVFGDSSDNFHSKKIRWEDLIDEIPFVALADTPDSFGTAGQVVVVNADADGLIFDDSSGTGLASVSTGDSITGDGTGGDPLDVADGGIVSAMLADNIYLTGNPTAPNNMTWGDSDTSIATTDFVKRASVQHYWIGAGNSLVNGNTIRLNLGSSIDDARSGDSISFVFNNAGSNGSDVSGTNSGKQHRR